MLFCSRGVWQTPPWADTPPWEDTPRVDNPLGRYPPPQADTPHPRQTPPPQADGHPMQRMVRILLECILVHCMYKITCETVICYLYTYDVIIYVQTKNNPSSDSMNSTRIQNGKTQIWSVKHGERRCVTENIDLRFLGVPILYIPE